MRESGILLHITSLPGPYGIGTMGKNAFAFVDFLKRAGQRYWQILPLNPTGYGDSPYQSCSTYAGNPYLIDLDLLVEEGLLDIRQIEDIPWSQSADRVDFGAQYQHRSRVLRQAFARFADTQALDAFCQDHGDWLPDFALYMALKERYQGKPWYQWDEKLKLREPKAVWTARQELKDSIRYYCFVQYLFFKQWNALRDYAHENDVRIIGDVPIYVPYDSADVWSNPEFFQLDEKLDPIAVAGCPPDAFTEDGQLWGNPVYDWDALKKDGYHWWLRRLEAAGKLCDVVRVDHFRGLESYWSVPYGDTTARNGKWVQGPGADFMQAVKTALPGLDMILEDLGYLTQEVIDLRDSSGYPGMKVLSFAFDSREPSDYLPHAYSANSVCYTGTHDNMPIRQWFETAPKDAVEYAAEYMRLSEEEGYAWGTVRTAFASVSDICITPIQDILDLGGESRMNLPGSMSGANWTWRTDESCMAPALAEKLYRLTKLYGRLCQNYNSPE